MKNLKFLLPLAMLAVFVFACEKEKSDPLDTGYSRGVYIVNEGTYTQNNGSVSYYNPEENTIINDLFQLVNGRPLGDVVQSMAVANDSIGYIVVNASAKIEVLNLRTFKTITDPVPVMYPRYFLQVEENKGYLTAGNFQGYVYVFDILSATKKDSIAVGFGPETMIADDGLVFVANSGGWSSDSTISIIDCSIDKVTDTIWVGLCPVDMTKDSDGYIWVYSRGYTNWADINTTACIQKIDPVSQSIVWVMNVGYALDYSSSPAKCAVSADGKTIYYLRPDGMYSINASTPQNPDEPLIEGNFYGLDVNPKDGNIYLFETSFTSNGTLKIFDDEGNLLSQGMAGIGPSSAVFNY